MPGTAGHTETFNDCYHARLAEQGLARHLIRFEAGFAPSSSPCEEERLHARQGLIDTQKGKETAKPSLFPLFQSRSNGGGVEPPYRVARRGEMMYDIP